MHVLLRLRAQPALNLLRYHSLVAKYGKLEPLAEIDLRPRRCAQVEVHCEEKVQQVISALVHNSSESRIA